MVQSFWKSVQEFLKKLKLYHVTQIHHYWDEPQCIPYSPTEKYIYVYCCYIHEKKEIKVAQMSINRQADNEDMVNTHNGIYSFMRKIKL